jgi:hypothetical protein
MMDIVSVHPFPIFLPCILRPFAEDKKILTFNPCDALMIRMAIAMARSVLTTPPGGLTLVFSVRMRCFPSSCVEEAGLWASR